MALVSEMNYRNESLHYKTDFGCFAFSGDFAEGIFVNVGASLAGVVTFLDSSFFAGVSGFASTFAGFASTFGALVFAGVLVSSAVTCLVGALVSSFGASDFAGA